MRGNTMKTLEQAEEKAKEMVSSDQKLAHLITEAYNKAKHNYEFLLAPWESLQILLRMTKAWVVGRYSPPVLTVVGSVAALLYLVEPFDMLPDPIPVFGYLDDAAIIAGVVRANLSAISQFRNWEASLRGPHSQSKKNGL